MIHPRTTPVVLAALALSAGLAVAGSHISTLHGNSQLEVSQQDDDPRTDTLARLSTRIDAQFSDQPARDVFNYLADLTGADILVVYESDIDPEGIDPELPINFDTRNRPALDVLERLIRTLNAELVPTSRYTWQMTQDGAYQVGPRDALDRETRMQIYDIGELLFEVPYFSNAPDFELQTSTGAQGGGQSPFGGGGGDDEERLTEEEKRENLIEVITTVVEPDAWVQLGGTSATISTYQRSLIVTAPDYVHRALGGYDFWPSSLQTRRYNDGKKETVIRAKPSRRGP